MKVTSRYSFGSISKACSLSALLLFLLPALARAFCFEEAGKVYGVSPILLRGIAKVESGENPAASNRNRNGSVDLGLMQINSSWLKPLGASARDLVEQPCYNVMVGAWILSDCLNRYGNSWEAVGCYNARGHDHRVTYSWKIYRQLLKEPKAKPQDARTAATASAARPPHPPRPPHAAVDQVTKRQGRSLSATGKEATVPAVSSFNVSVTDIE